MPNARDLVRHVERLLRQGGVDASMSRLRDAISTALYGRNYAAAIAAEGAGALPAPTPQVSSANLLAALERARMDPELLRQSIATALSDESVPAEPHLARILACLDDLAVRKEAGESPRVARALMHLLGYKRGRVWPEIQLSRASSVEALSAVYARLDMLGSWVPEPVVAAVRGSLDETATKQGWDRLPCEAVFLNRLRRMVATGQASLSSEVTSVLIRAGQLVRSRVARHGVAEIALIPLVSLSDERDPRLLVLRDVVVDVDPTTLPLDPRAEQDRVPTVAIADIDGTNAQRALVSPKEARLVLETVELLCRDRDPDELDAQRIRLRIAESIRYEPMLQMNWSAERREKDAQWLRLEVPPKQRGADEDPDSEFDLFGGGFNRAVSLGDSFPSRDRLPDAIFALLERQSLPFTPLEHVVYFWLFNFEEIWAHSAAARIRLNPSEPSAPALPACAMPMACSVKWGSSRSPAIVIGADDEFADALVLAPAMLNGTRRMRVKLATIKEGIREFERAIRSKARLLEYELDDTSANEGVPMADSFDEAFDLAY